MDLRMDNSKNIVNTKDYKTDTDFSCLCTTADGRLAVGSNKGVVRMYSGVDKSSSNNFFTLQHNNITMLDSTKDGRFLLVTTPIALFLLDTLAGEKNTYENRITSRSKEIRPMPIQFSLKVEDLHKYQIKEECFNKARFDEGQKEKHVIASVGSFIVTWSIRNILRGHT